MISAAMIYASRPLPPSAQNTTQPRRTSVESMLKYSAMPPHTPAIFLSVLLLYSFLPVHE